MKDKTQPGHVRNYAANSPIDRGYGRPPQHIHMQTRSDAPVAIRAELLARALTRP
jgi:hypothetical protein